MDKLRALMLLNATGTVTARFFKEAEMASSGGPLDPRELIEEGESFWRRVGFSEGAVSFLKVALKESWAERELERCSALGVMVITWGSDEYPALLEDLDDPPLVLYVIGDKLPSFGVGIVGTRRCTSYGSRVAGLISENVASLGMDVISGGALGIDSAAHKGCMSAGGKTIAVLGTGVDVVYPSSNRWLFEEIKESGSLVSEYPLGTKARQWTFPRRNRIIAGLSEKLVVVEAPVKSGAMITARVAMDLGREVWAVPGRITDESSGGSNSLIADGAHVLYDVCAFMESFRGHQLFLKGLGLGVSKKQSLPNLSEKQMEIYEFLCKYGEQTVDNIAVGCKMDAAQVLQELGYLSIEELVFPSGPGRWSAIPKGTWTEKR